jgi:hypothetical protein
MNLGSAVFRIGRNFYLMWPGIVKHGIYDGIYLGIVRRFPTIMYLRPGTQGWSIRRRGELTGIEREGKELLLDHIDAVVTLNEWPMWERYLLPPFDLKGKTVLDIGAACGDTAFFYFLHGAGKVVGVELDKNRCAAFSRNAGRLGWNAEIIKGPFKSSQLSIPHDFLKMDCEGGEASLLDVESLGPAVMELHPWIIGQRTMDTIVSKFRLRRMYAYLWTNIPRSTSERN